MTQSSTGNRFSLLVVQGGKSSNPPPASHRKKHIDIDHLEYMSDMIRQLQRIARHVDCSTLARILELASCEVDLQRRERYGGL